MQKSNAWAPVLAILSATHGYGKPMKSSDSPSHTMTAWIQDIAITAGDHPDVACPTSFRKINVDLNAGAGGKYIYLCFTKIDALQRPSGTIVSGLKVIATQHESQAQFFTGGCAQNQNAEECRGFFALPFNYSNGDANQGVGGYYIHIYKETAYQFCDEFICTFSDWYDGFRLWDIKVVAGQSEEVACPSNYEKLPIDLNLKARGNYIYICQLRTPFAAPTYPEAQEE